ncbi:MAG: AbrB/MazE/SpoVT family DNA-binding domain-containing protein [Solirubrobacterales bacterium]
MNKKKTTRVRDGKVKVTSQGQISIPRQVMREAGVKPGDRLQASTDGEGRIILEHETDPLLAIIGSAPPGIWDGAQAEIRRMRDEEWDRSF